MSVGESSVKPSRISPFDSDAERAYDDAEWGDESNSRLYLEENVKIYDGENHYIKVDFNYSGKANIYLEWDDDSDLDLYFFDRDGLELDHNTASKDKTNSSGNKFALIYGIDINEDSNYLVGIRAFDTDGSYCRYTLKVKLYDDRYDYNDMLDDIGVDDSIDRSYKFYEYGEDRDLLEYGDEGTDVAHLQRLLVKLNYLDEDEIDGIFGRDTRSAVRNFQEDWHVLVDEIVGPKTRKIIEESIDWKRYGSYLRKCAVIRAALERSGIANACKVTLPSNVIDEEYEYGPFPAGPFSVTYKIGYDYDPTNSMVKVTTNGRTSSTQINISDKIDAVVEDSGLNVNLKPFKDILTAVETEENSQIYISHNFPTIKLDSKGFSFNGPNITMAVKKTLTVDLGNENVVDAVVYEELKLEPRPQDYSSSTNTSIVRFSQSMAQPGSNPCFEELSGSLLIGIMAALAYKGSQISASIASSFASFCVIPASLWEQIKKRMFQDYQA